MANIGTIISGYLHFDAVAGTTYELSITGTSGEFGYQVYDVNNNNLVGEFIGGEPFNGSLMRVTPSETTSAKFWLDGGVVASFEVARSVDDIINDALVSVKAYIDTKDASVKTYAETKIAELVNTTNLTEKLALLTEINAILDGDTATAGFQLWESSVSKLNQINVDLNAIKASASNPFASMKSKAATIFAV